MLRESNMLLVKIQYPANSKLHFRLVTIRVNNLALGVA